MSQETTAIQITAIEIATNDDQIQACYKIMRQLRSHLTKEQKFIEQIQRQCKEGYHLIYLLNNEAVRAVAGFRFLECLA